MTGNPRPRTLARLALGLILLAISLFAAGSLWASIGSGKRADAAEYQYPTVYLSASPNHVAPGQTSTLTWSSTDVTSCTAYGSWSGSRPTSGNEVVTVWGWANGFYDLSCTGSDG